MYKTLKLITLFHMETYRMEPISYVSWMRIYQIFSVFMIMSNFQKHFIGKGTHVNNLNIVRITSNISTLEQYAHIYNGQAYITFEVAQLQKPQFGKTHTVFVSKLIQEPTLPAPKPTKRKAATAKQ